jgi:hypothetical protein
MRLTPDLGVNEAVAPPSVFESLLSLPTEDTDLTRVNAAL